MDPFLLPDTIPSAKLYSEPPSSVPNLTVRSPTSEPSPKTLASSQRSIALRSQSSLKTEDGKTPARIGSDSSPAPFILDRPANNTDFDETRIGVLHSTVYKTNQSINQVLSFARTQHEPLTHSDHLRFPTHSLLPQLPQTLPPSPKNKPRLLTPRPPSPLLSLIHKPYLPIRRTLTRSPTYLSTHYPPSHPPLYTKPQHFSTQASHQVTKSQSPTHSDIV